MSLHPNVALVSRSPLVVAWNPYPATMRWAGNDDLLFLRWRWSDSYPHADMQLRGSRSRNSKESTEESNPNSSFHESVGYVEPARAWSSDGEILYWRFDFGMWYRRSAQRLICLTRLPMFRLIVVPLFGRKNGIFINNVIEVNHREPKTEPPTPITGLRQREALVLSVRRVFLPTHRMISQRYSAQRRTYSIASERIRHTSRS